jgi:hypothetical protein
MISVADSEKNWKSIIDLVSELKRCDEYGITTASLAMAYICIDTIANLARPINKPKVTRADFIEFVDTYLKAHPDQPYQYRGKDVYAARCAFLHTYGSEAALHEEDSDTLKFVYHDGGKHQYKPSVEPSLVVIGTKSFINDVIIAVDLFLKKCQSDVSLQQRVESRLVKVLQIMPYPSS